VPPFWDGKASERIVDVLAAADLDAIRAGWSDWSAGPRPAEPSRI
jgi:hypothetical protein